MSRIQPRGEKRRWGEGVPDRGNRGSKNPEEEVSLVHSRS